MAESTERLSRLRERYRSLSSQLAEVGFIHRGSLMQRYTRCGTPTCSCHDDPPKLHGPYWQWSTKVRGKTVSRLISEEQARVYAELIESRKRFENIVAEMYELSEQALEILAAEDQS